MNLAIIGLFALIKHLGLDIFNLFLPIWYIYSGLQAAHFDHQQNFMGERVTIKKNSLYFSSPIYM